MNYFRNFIKKIIPGFIRKIYRTSILKQYLHGRKLAVSSHILDKRANILNHYFKLAKISNLNNQNILELGAGWFPAWSILFYLLGARKILVTDVKKQFFPSLLKLTLTKTNTEKLFLNLLPLENKNNLINRYDLLLKNRINFLFLKKIGIYYTAPFTLISYNPKEKFDFIFSNEVLQYVPETDLLPLFYSMKQTLVEGGKMLHFVHLEDMTFFKTVPFCFLEKNNTNIEPGRGNRLRYSSWNKMLKEVFGEKGKIIDRKINWKSKLPVAIDAKVFYEDEKDLRTSHIVIYVEN